RPTVSFSIMIPASGPSPFQLCSSANKHMVTDGLAVLLQLLRLSSAGFRGCSSSLCYLEAESCMLSPDGLLDIASGSGLKYLNLQKLRSSTGL
ncbi:hypothetical protein ACJX0J_016389, partial [Zea mays]